MKLLLLLTLAGAAQAQSGFTGEWMFSNLNFGETRHARLVIQEDSGRFTATFVGRPVTVAVSGREITLKDGNLEAKGTLDGGAIKGTVNRRGAASPFTAVRMPPRPAQASTHKFEPTQFELYFSSAPKPVLRVHPGDTIRTWGVDASGIDAKGVKRSAGGNPQTGPFFIEGALPGDTLVVRINSLRLNRDWAESGSSVVFNALQPNLVRNLDFSTNFNSRWKLDREKGVAFLEKPTDKLKNFSVPLAPMVGCLGVAPPDDSRIRTRDSGEFGGNMDYNQIREGVTVYLPVFHPGALLFIGDGHAAQADGELTGDALETSMDFDFTVDIIKDRQFGQPLLENSEFIMSMGIGGSLPEALQRATSGMVRWLTRDYKLSAQEVAIILGFALKYDVADLVGTQVGLTAKVPKSALVKLERASP